MLKVGITGGIGSGKSLVCKLFLQLGIPVFNADIEAAKIMMDDENVQQEILGEFGQEIQANGIIDRKKLAEIVFNDDEKLNQLNAIIHPAVREKFELWASGKHVSYVIKEAAILIESGSHKDADAVILITAPEELRIKRVLQREDISVDQIHARMKNQWPDEKKRVYADFVINNNETELLIPQVLKIHDELLKR
ncbi:MAG: dephospho-CoA kinase [Flavobacteriales bacterium]|nr:MAG: dephospho-CoA kinase [Flavobacteriales bacterium]